LFLIALRVAANYRRSLRRRRPEQAASNATHHDTDDLGGSRLEEPSSND
jgi:hypothetical protein